jgi:hypothetical protein
LYMNTKYQGNTISLLFDHYYVDRRQRRLANHLNALYSSNCGSITTHLKNQLYRLRPMLLLLFPSFMTLPPLYEDIMVWTYQLYMVEEDPRCPSGQFSGSGGHLGRTTDVPQASWLFILLLHPTCCTNFVIAWARGLITKKCY